MQLMHNAIRNSVHGGRNGAGSLHE